MSEDGLEKTAAWDISLEEFRKSVLKEIHLNPGIPEELCEEASSINDLLIHSFYKSHFIDKAYTETIFLLEKVLRMRSEELKNGLTMKDSLAKFFKWFFDNSYFETTEITELDHLRDTRNKKVHYPKIFKGNLNFLINIYSIFDLMNDVYEDVPLRIKRRALTQEVNTQLNPLCGKGFIVELNGQAYFGHSVSALFYNNKLSPEILHLRIARCIVSKSAQVGADRDNYELVAWNYINDQFLGKLINGAEIAIKPLSELAHQKQFEAWQNDYPLWSLTLFDSLERSCYQEKLREFHKTS